METQAAQPTNSVPVPLTVAPLTVKKAKRVRGGTGKIPGQVTPAILYWYERKAREKGIPVGDVIGQVLTAYAKRRGFPLGT